MTIVVNGQPQDVAPEANVADVVPRHATDPGGRGVAVAVNGELVARAAWKDTPLSDGDHVEIVGAVQGG